MTKISILPHLLLRLLVVNLFLWGLMSTLKHLKGMVPTVVNLEKLVPYHWYIYKIFKANGLRPTQ